jgi:hypothetical protein
MIHDSAEIYERAVKLLETFWLEDEMILPSGVMVNLVSRL